MRESASALGHENLKAEEQRHPRRLGDALKDVPLPNQHHQRKVHPGENDLLELGTGASSRRRKRTKHSRERPPLKKPRNPNGKSGDARKQRQHLHPRQRIARPRFPPGIALPRSLHVHRQRCLLRRRQGRDLHYAQHRVHLDHRPGQLNLRRHWEHGTIQGLCRMRQTGQHCDRRECRL